MLAMYPSDLFSVWAFRFRTLFMLCWGFNFWLGEVDCWVSKILLVSWVSVVYFDFSFKELTMRAVFPSPLARLDGLLVTFLDFSIKGSKFYELRS